MRGAELDVLEANEAFYRAFAGRDLDAMSALWASEHPVACIHPGWDVLDGRDAVLSSWQGILGSDGAPEIACALAEARVLGEVAFVTCRETVGDTHLVASNVFVRERRAWRLVLHQATPIALGQEHPLPRSGPAN